VCRRDKLLQTLVYKMIPGLLNSKPLSLSLQ